MKISELIEEFVPCEVCGNNDLENFYFYVLMNKSFQAYVKCCDCEETYYSSKARKNLVKVEDLSKVITGSRATFKNKYKESVHPLVRVLTQI